MGDNGTMYSNKHKILNQMPENKLRKKPNPIQCLVFENHVTYTFKQYNKLRINNYIHHKLKAPKD